MNAFGSLVCVGIGVRLDAHMTPMTDGYIRDSDVVFAVGLDVGARTALTRMHRDVRHLSSASDANSSLVDESYGIAHSLLDEVRSGKKVCAAFYGHPGVFAGAAHIAIHAARKEGFPAHMEPALSAADCLYADLGIDPGRYGCQHYDASQIMFYRRSIDTSAYLILWQVGAKERRSAPYRQLLTDVLAREYPLDHNILVYSAPIATDQQFSLDRARIDSLVHLDLHPLATIVIPPAADLLPDVHVKKRLAELDALSSL
jgi:uncharacterized protein YabN with tetrapyrrole methylase and pyrophosphatase domain